MILDLFKLDGKVAIVTGGGKGIGQAYVAGLAEAGADIALVDVIPTDETAAQVRSLGRRVLQIKADLSDAACAEPVIAQVAAAFGGVDILVNNAGIIRRAPLVEYTEKDWDDVMNVNLRTVFFLCKAAARQMIAQGRGGKIINIASMLSFQGGILVPSYTASKSAIRGITMLMANELAKHGICVNAIAPGYIATDNTAPIRADPARNQTILDRIPAGRWGATDDLKGICVFLASAASNYMNGTTVAVDGGWLAR